MKTKLSTLFALVAAAVLVSSAVLPGGAEESEPQTYIDEIREWQAGRDESYASDTGWLTVAGFYWLEPGDNSFGTGDDVYVPLPPGTAPAHAGVLHYAETDSGFVVTLTMADGVEATIDDRRVTTQTLTPDNPGPSDKVKIDRITMWVLKRSGKPAIRYTDPESELLKNFRGIDRYDIDPAWCLPARFVAYDEKRPLIVPNQLGHVDTSFAYGEVVFEVGGEERSLIPMMSDENDSTFFFVFSDETTGEETYGAGRFLYTPLRSDGTVTMDFNRAYNPPCAFNPWTTCPLPPEGNDLKIAVRAGEKDYAGDLH